MSSIVYYCFVVSPELTIFSPSHFAKSLTVVSHSVHFTDVVKLSLLVQCSNVPCGYALCSVSEVFALTTVAKWRSKKPCDRKLQLPGVRL